MMKNSTSSLFNNSVIAILVILNLVMLAFVWQSRRPNDGPRHHPPDRNRNFIQEELGFSDEQTEQLHQLREQHFQTTQPILGELRELRTAMFDQLKTDRDSTLVEEYATRIGRDQAQLESATYHHFLQIRNICTPEQQVIFDQLLGEIIRPPRNEGPPGKHREGPPPR